MDILPSVLPRRARTSPTRRCHDRKSPAAVVILLTLIPVGLAARIAGSGAVTCASRAPADPGN